MSRIIIASHVALVNGKEYDGIGNVVKATLFDINEDFIFIKNSMDGLLQTEACFYRGGSLIKSEIIKVINKISVLRYITEVSRVVRYFSKKPDEYEYFVGIDPLNALTGIILKKKNIVKNVIFYTPDYSPKRFNNFLLNGVYHLIDKYCVKKSDEVWSVSSRIVEIRKSMGLEDKKNIFLPNVPPVMSDRLKSNKHNKYELVTTGIIDKQLDFNGILEAISILKNEYPKISLTVVGNGPEEDNVKKIADSLGISERLNLVGRKSLEETLDIQSKAGVGLALYTGIWGFNKYGDSTKCREYFAFGLPVLSTDTHATVDDINKYHAGEIVDMNSEEYVIALRKIFDNYEKYSKHSKILGDTFKELHKKEFTRILNIR